MTVEIFTLRHSLFFNWAWFNHLIHLVTLFDILFYNLLFWFFCFLGISLLFCYFFYFFSCLFNLVLYILHLLFFLWFLEFIHFEKRWFDCSFRHFHASFWRIHIHAILTRKFLRWLLLLLLLHIFFKRHIVALGGLVASTWPIWS